METVEFGRIEDMLAEAHALGYRRGVEDAAKVAKSFGDAQDVAYEILDLLEQTSDTNSERKRPE
jgi:hypothetical protein